MPVAVSRHLVAAALAALGLAGLSGCVKRTLTVTSEPSGALVWLNDREVGRTPVTIEFVYYGEYDVRLQKAGFEPVMTGAHVRPPWWDNVPVDFIAEVAPLDLNSVSTHHFVMTPVDPDRDRLVDRARGLRAELGEVSSAAGAANDPGDDAEPDGSVADG